MDGPCRVARGVPSALAPGQSRNAAPAQVGVDFWILALPDRAGAAHPGSFLIIPSLWRYGRVTLRLRAIGKGAFDERA
jgi:hypothetical protein